MWFSSFDATHRYVQIYSGDINHHRSGFTGSKSRYQRLLQCERIGLAFVRVCVCVCVCLSCFRFDSMRKANLFCDFCILEVLSLYNSK